MAVGVPVLSYFFIQNRAVSALAPQVVLCKPLYQGMAVAAAREDELIAPVTLIAAHSQASLHRPAWHLNWTLIPSLLSDTVNSISILLSHQTHAQFSAVGSLFP